MSLAPGTRLGHYEIVSPLGAGGMGEVYRARDTKLGREVAIKVLPDAGGADPDRLARFAREAQTLASLNHPNIAQIYGLEESAQGAAIAMELVEGEDLARRIARGPIPIEDVWPIARQVAEALEAAHDAGIIHRDLKPGNIMIRRDGVVKVLDFGLAKALGAEGGRAAMDPSNSPTLTAHATQMGIVLGTAAYMSPEQARGKAVDKRTDIWAFGCVVFEMLTGRQAFTGETVTDILAAVVKNEPDWQALPKDTPQAVRAVLRRCLVKDVKARLRDIGDGRLEISDPEAATVVAAVTPTASRARWFVPAVLAALVIGAISGILWRASRDVPPAQWAGTRLGGPALALYPRASPDSQLLGFIAMVDGLSQVAVMKPGTGNWSVLTRERMRGRVDAIAWSSDGSRIYFDRVTDAPHGIYSVPALGGEERLLIENASAPQPLPDGSLLLLRINKDRLYQLHRFRPDTGQLDPLPALTGFAGLFRPFDEGRVAIFGRPMTEAAGEDRLHLLTLSSGQMTRVGPDIPTGSLVSMAVRSRERSVLLSVRDGSGFRVLEVLLDGTRAPQSLLTLFSQPHLDGASDGSIFMDLVDRDPEIVHFREGSAVVNRWAGGPTLFKGAVALNDGRFLITERLGDTAKVLVVTPGKEPVRLVETTEDTGPPVTAVGPDRVALLIGSGATPDIALVAVDSGRILKRLKAPGTITSLAASPDGEVLYATVGGTITVLPVDGSNPRSIGSGDSLTVDPDTGDLIVKLDEADGYRLVRLSPSGGTPVPITIKGDLKMVAVPLLPGAVRKGRLLVPVATADSSYWYPGVVDLRTGVIQRVTIDYFTDFHGATWAADGSIIGSAIGAEGALWRFTRVKSP